MTNFEIEKTNSCNLTNDECIKKTDFKAIQLCSRNTNIYFQNELNIIKVITHFLENLENFFTFFFHDVVSFSNFWSCVVFEFYWMFFFIANLHQMRVSFFFVDIDLENNWIVKFIIDKNQGRRKHKVYFQKIHDFLLRNSLIKLDFFFE
jgi:hypothetical protein